MNLRVVMLSIVGILIVVGITFVFRSHNTEHFTSEETRTALNEIGQFLTATYQKIDYIDDSLDRLSENPHRAPTIIEYAKHNLQQITAQLTSGECSMYNQLKELANNIEELVADEEEKTAFKETIQDFNNQQEQLLSYLQEVQNKAEVAAETLAFNR